ncbi:MAG: TonB-dependent receptor [Bacteroidales bacterium]|nr:TonB-dependent receptor [Bacteroidales bacterium]
MITSNLVAQDLTQTIRGTVKDADTETPLPGATIMLLDVEPQKGTTTNNNGRFQLNDVTVGRHDIRITYVGYKPKTFRNISVSSGKELVLDVDLQEKVSEIDEVVVSAYRKDRPNNEMASVSARSFTIEETDRYAGSWGDPSRMAQNYAGVVSAGDQRNDIIIRGNSPSRLLWRLEGVNIPNPNHFGALGATGGPVSILNNNVLSNSDFFTGAFPAEYGNALSGVFDLEMRNGNSSKREYTGRIGFNGFELGAEGPFSDSSNASYLINYRYSTLALVDKIGLDMGVGAVPEYQDVNFKINVPTKKGNFSLFGIGGLSHIVLGENRDDSDYSYNTPKGYRTKNGSDMGVAGFSYTHFFDQKTRLKNSLSVAGHRVATTIDSVFEDNKQTFYHENNKQWKMGWNSKLVKKFNAKNRLDIGLSIENYSVTYVDSTLKNWTNNDDEYIKQLNVDENNLLVTQAYSQWQHHFTDSLTLYTGAHFQHFNLNDSWSLEPRASIEWKFRKDQSVSLGYGYHSKLPPFFLYFVRSHLGNQNYIQTNRDLEFSKSNQFVLSYNRRFTPSLRLKMEAYYQHQHNIPVEQEPSYFSLANYGASFHQNRMDSLVNNGLGRSYGVEFTLERFFQENYYFLLTTSLFESKYKPSDGGFRNTAFNGNYVANLLGGYEFDIGNQNVIAINLRMVRAGGKRYTPVDKEKSIEKGYTVYDREKAYENQYDDYFRMDARISLKINDKNLTQEWALDITNVTDHKNVFSKSFNASENEIITEYQQGFFPMMFYTINF